MSSLKEQFHDLVENVPHYVAPDAGAAWAAGRRRRTRRRAGVTVLVVVLVALAGLGVSRLPHRTSVAPAGSNHQRVTGYPTRIDYSYWLSDLPARPGPVAGVVQRGRYAPSWDAVSSSGRLWRIPGMSSGPDYYPALSADGTELGYLAGGYRGRYVIRDLVTGAVRSFPSVGTLAGDNHAPDWLQNQAPGFWSPDDTAVATAGGVRSRGTDWGRYILLIRTDGSVTPVAGPRRANLAGWLGDRRLVWVEQGKDPYAVVTDLTGRVVRRTSLAASQPTDQWIGPVSPDGRYLAGSREFTDAASVPRVFDLLTGATAPVRRVVEGGTRFANACEPSWGGETLYLPHQGPPDAGVPLSGLGTDGSTILTGPAGPVTVADPRLHIVCSMWASDALSGGAHRGISGLLFGMGGYSFAWYWREEAVVILAVIGLVVGVRAVRRLRRRRGSFGTR